MTIIVTSTYESLTLVQKDVYIYWTFCQAQLGKTCKKKRDNSGIVSFSLCLIIILIRDFVKFCT